MDDGIQIVGMVQSLDILSHKYKSGRFLSFGSTACMKVLKQKAHHTFVPFILFTKIKIVIGDRRTTLSKAMDCPSKKGKQSSTTKENAEGDSAIGAIY